MHRKLTLDIPALVSAYKSGTSAVQLAKRNRCSVWSIITRLRKASVEIRPDGVRKSLDLSPENYEIFVQMVDGMLLGDGSISKKKPSIRIQQVEKRFGWIDEIANSFSKIDVSSNTTNIPPKTTEIDGRRINATPSRVLYLPLCNESREQRKRWYPGDIKRVPQDIRLTPLSVAYWFCGDGTYDSMGGLFFCTNSFEKEDVERLAEGLCNLGIEARCAPVNLRRPGEYKVSITKRNAAQALKEFVEPYMAVCCMYKLEYVRPVKSFEEISRSHRAITDEQIQGMRQARRDGMTIPATAKKFGVSKSSVEKYTKGYRSS